MDRRRLERCVASYFDHHGVVVMVYPTVPVTSRPVKGVGGQLIEHNGSHVNAKGLLTRNADFAATVGLPSLSVPVGTETIVCALLFHGTTP